MLHRRWRTGRVAGASAVALQGEAANHRKVRRSRAGVLSVAEKARHRARQVWIKKANVSEPLMTRRNGKDDIETGAEPEPRDEPGGCLPIGQAVSGVEAARAWSGLRCGTWEPVVPRSRTASGAVLACGRFVEARTPSSRSARGRVVMRGTGADRPVVAVTPGNAGRATGAGHPGLLSGQPR